MIRIVRRRAARGGHATDRRSEARRSQLSETGSYGERQEEAHRGSEGPSTWVQFRRPHRRPGHQARTAGRRRGHRDLQRRPVHLQPSFIWIPFGKRKPQDITFPVAPTFETHQVNFVHAEATRIDPQHQQVATTNGSYGFDYLVVATGYLEDFTPIPGAGPGGPAHAITSLAGALAAADGWQRLLADPWPVVVAAAQGTGCFGAAYEFVFNSPTSPQARPHQAGADHLCDRRAVPGPLRDQLPGGERLLGMFSAPASRPSSTAPSPRSCWASAAGRRPPAAIPLRGHRPAIRGRAGGAHLRPRATPAASSRSRTPTRPRHSRTSTRSGSARR